MVALTWLAATCALGQQEAQPWAADFRKQPASRRPRLECRYVDARRERAEIIGETYGIVIDLADGTRHASISVREPDGFREAGVLRLEAHTEDGRTYSSEASSQPSRINLYRRGPYYLDVRWLDITCSTDGGEAFPAMCEVALHCYPEKVHIEAIWHGVGDAGPGRAALVLEGALEGFDTLVPSSAEPPSSDLARSEAHFDALGEGASLRAWLAFGASADPAYPVTLEEPLSSGAVTVLDGLGARYDPIRGCYVVGTHNPGGFNYHFYENPNHYETAQFAIANDGQPRKVYVCHETTSGALGSVECGVLLDERGDLLPVMVQTCKNFAGENEEPFYNPGDPAFSETYFPLHLEANETRQLTSLHLYQDWGNHPLKQFSSLGAWMDYFHSSTGVTETTCFVPFKFGGLPGVSIADLRPMSQRMWESQPQHDNVAGHRFLMYASNGRWHYTEYTGTEFRSTGPNWMDVSFGLLSDDGRISARLDSFELPQPDELRNFIRLRAVVHAPIQIKRLSTDMRLLDITSRIQALRYTRAAWQGTDGRIETRELRPVDELPIPGEPLGGENPWATVYGEPRGCNAFIVRRWDAVLGGLPREPAVCVDTSGSGDMSLALTPVGGEAELRPGDYIDAEIVLLPYGDGTSTYETPEIESRRFGRNAPRIVDVAVGERIADFPTRIRADESGLAQFTVTGGASVIPIIVEGLATYRNPRLETLVNQVNWARVPHERIGNDGYQVFAADDGTFSCVFLVNTDGTTRTYRVAAGQPLTVAATPSPSTSEEPLRHVVEIQAQWMEGPVQLRFPETIQSGYGLLQIDHHREDMPALTDPATLAGWHRGPGGSVWFDWDLAARMKAGGSVSPDGDEARLDFWVYNGNDEATDVATQFCLVLADPLVRDGTGERSYIRSGGRWLSMADGDRGTRRRELVHYPVVGGGPLSWMEAVPDWGASADVADVGLVAVVAADGQHVLGLAWERPRSILSNWFIPCVHADPMWPQCPPKSRVEVRGMLYLIEGTLDDLLDRYREDFAAPVG